jgi:hypothetical protein
VTRTVGAVLLQSGEGELHILIVSIYVDQDSEGPDQAVPDILHS